MTKAVVVGGTGAIGRELVGTLLTNGHWSHVVTVGRRPVEVPAAYPPDTFKAKLEQVIVNMDNLETDSVKAFEGASDVFCTLGTTRKDAGSAEQVIKVDVEYVAKTARAAKGAGAQHFSLVTVQGANPNIWASKLAIFHGLLYLKTKGQAEEAVKAQGFPHVSIFRPGMLLRGDMARPQEKWVAKLISGIAVADVARCMVADAARLPIIKPPVAVYEMGALLSAVKRGDYVATPN